MRLGNVDQIYRNAWTNAYVRWNADQSKRTFRYQANGSSLLTAELDSSRPSTYGRIIYQGRAGRTNPFHTYLNTHVSSIRSNANVRQSTASHELGHALGLADNSLSFYYEHEP